MRRIAVIMFILLLLIAGCKQAVKPTAEDKAGGEETTEKTEISNDLNQVEQLDDELGLEELEDLELEIDESVFE